MQIIPILVALIFAILGLLHFKWAIYGIKKPELVLPIKPSESKLKTPSTVSTALVGFVLLLFSLLFLNETFTFWRGKWTWYIQIGVGILFFFRSVGDFKHVGFFKTIKDTPFAKMDTKFYSPLCLIIALLIGISVFGH